jgi:hypothetical protein
VRCGACLDVFDARAQAVPATGTLPRHEVPATPLLDDTPIGTAHPRLSDAGDDAGVPSEAQSGEPPLAPADVQATVDTHGALASGAPDAVMAGPLVTGPLVTGPVVEAPVGDAQGAPRFLVLDPQADEPAGNDPARRRRAVLETVPEPTPGLTPEERSQFDVLALDPEEFPAPAPRRWRLLGFAAAGLLLVAAQVLYFKVDEWSSDADIRPVYEALCVVLGCTVPTYRDPTALQGTNVVVRPHPERADLLLVDAQVLNTAPYGQAFPDLRLDLLDRDGNIVSSRVFEPDEYRGGELATMPDVPPNRPLQVSLEVYRPRAAVVNFRFELLPAPPRP